MGLTEWRLRRKTLRDLRYQLQVRELEARLMLAAYKVKADIEWDMKWANLTTKSYKDEALLFLWSIPLIFFIVQYARGDKVMVDMLSSNSLSWYAGGWAIILAATFGAQRVADAWGPSPSVDLGEAFARAPNDIPEDVISSIHQQINKT